MKNKSTPGTLIPAQQSTAPSVVAPASIPHNKKKSFLGIVVLVILLLVVVIIWHDHSKKKIQPKAVTASAVCTNQANSPTLSQAAGAIYQNDVVTLGQVVPKLKSIPSYQYDPNCLYALVIYYLDVDDVQNANLYLTKLEAVYNSKQGFSAMFVAPVSIAALKNSVSEIQAPPKAAKNPVTAVSNPNDNN